VQKVQAPAQPFIAFDPARPAEDQSARRARRVFSCPSIDLYADAGLMQHQKENVLAKAEFLAYNTPVTPHLQEEKGRPTRKE
jgi:hypothetical protein